MVEQLELNFEKVPPGFKRVDCAYAKVGGPPDEWWGIHVFDLDTGEEILGVIEINCEEGFLVRHVYDIDIPYKTTEILYLKNLGLYRRIDD